MVTRSKYDIFKPKQFHLATKFPLSDQIEPSCLSQTLKHSEWRQAMSKEFNALLANGTWSLVCMQPQFNIISNKWIFLSQVESRWLYSSIVLLPGVSSTSWY